MVTTRFTGMSPEAAENVIESVASGVTMKRWAEAHGINYMTVASYISKHYREELRVARAEGANALAEEAIRIASEPMVLEEEIITTNADGSETRSVKRADAVHARKLAAWTRMELAKAWNPDVYGQRINVKDESSMAAALAEARKRIETKKTGT